MIKNRANQLEALDDEAERIAEAAYSADYDAAPAIKALVRRAVQSADAPVAWRVRGYAQFKTGTPGPWRYFDGAERPKVNDPDCCDIEPLYSHAGVPPSPAPRFNFSIRPKHGDIPRVLAWADGGCRPATDEESAMWDALHPAGVALPDGEQHG